MKRRVLITNNTLGPRAGSEMYVRDVAVALLKHGWQPMAFSTVLGEVAAELRGLSIPVIDDLTKVAEPPDLIHAHHHLDAMVAIQQFPGVPVIYYCHGWTPWEEMPLRHPRIVRYVAVDELCRERLVIEGGIPEALVEVHLNFVDMERFQSRAPLPTRLMRAMTFSNVLAPGHSLNDVLQRACAEQGLSLNHIGEAAGASASRPWEVLSTCDVVFAKGRAALEALAVGCAVIVCDGSGLGGLVRPDNFDTFRSLNFGFRTLRNNPTPSVADVVAELKKYDVAACAAASQRIRSEAKLSTAMEKLVGLYERVLSEFSPSSISIAGEQQAVAAYLLWLARETKDLRSARWQHEEAKRAAQIQQLQAALAERQQELLSVRGELSAIREELSRNQNEVSGLAGEITRMNAKLKQGQSKIEHAKVNNDALKEKAARYRSQRDEARAHLQRFSGLRRFLPSWLAKASPKEP